MVNTDYMLARHILPMMVDSYNKDKCSYAALMKLRDILHKRNIDDDYDMEVLDIDSTYSIILLTFTETGNIDDVAYSAVVVNHSQHIAHYYILKHSVEYNILDDGHNFDFTVKGCSYGIFIVEMNNEYGGNDTFETADKEMFIGTVLDIARMEDSVSEELQDDMNAKEHEAGMKSLRKNFAWNGPLPEGDADLNGVFDCLE